MQIGRILMDFLSPILQSIGPYLPGKTFPHFFITDNGPGLFENALVSAFFVTFLACIIGNFLIIRNLSLLGDGLAHVSFGGICVGIAIGYTSPLLYALFFSIISSILIFEMQRREILAGDASIAIFSTGMLGFGLFVLKVWGGGITLDVEGYLYGNLLLIDQENLDLILIISILSIFSITLIRNSLLAISIDPIAARVQGLPAREIGLFFSIITAAVIVSMVKIIGILLVTALLITPAATAQQVGTSFRSCLIWSQFFGFISVLIGLYISAETSAGSGSTIALVTAVIFVFVSIYTNFLLPRLSPKNNL